MKQNKKMFVFAGISLLVFSLGTAAYARPMGYDYDGPMFRGTYFTGHYMKDELDALKTELANKTLGDLNAVQIWERISTAESKDRYVSEAYRMSFVFPGAGQFRDGDTGKGFGFAALNLTIIAGTIAGVYFLLPADLRFDKLDYFDTPFRTIGDVWNAHTFTDYLPSIGVSALGMIAGMGVRFWSAKDAYSGAIQAVDSGKAKLEPVIGPGFFGMRMWF